MSHPYKAEKYFAIFEFFIIIFGFEFKIVYEFMRWRDRRMTV